MKHISCILVCFALLISTPFLALAQENPEESGAAAQNDGDSQPRIIVMQEDVKKAFVSESQKEYAKMVANKKPPHYYKLKVKKKNTSDWLDTEQWFKDNQFSRPELDRTEGAFTYKGIPGKGHYGHEYNSIEITNNVTGQTWIYDFTSFGIHDQFQPYIHYAIARNGWLYVALAHDTYQETNPDTAFILAVSMNSGKVIWRSNNLVCNASNFLILDNTIVCGYGFTAEPDFVYTIDILTGKTMGKLPIKSKAYYFIQPDEESHVIRMITYNTDYTLTYK